VQPSGAGLGVGPISSSRRLNTRLAIAAVMVIAAAALLMWVVSLVADGVGTEDAIPMPEPKWATLYDDAGKAHLVHVQVGGAKDAPPWVRLHDSEGNPHLVQAR
jgi:hypothetical protein